MNARQWETLQISVLAQGVLECRLNRPGKRNAISIRMWDELRDFFGGISGDGSVRVVLLTGEGKLFCSGVDLEALASLSVSADSDIAHNALTIRSIGKHWQDAFTNVEKCGKVVIACIHGACVGAGVELIAAADIRFCTDDALFSLKEVDVGLAADVGGLQRLPKLVGNQSLVRELVFSGRNLSAPEASRFGLVSRMLPSQKDMLHEALELAKIISSKSPVALLGAKTFLNYSRDHSVDESLEYAITWNQGMLQSRDVVKAATAQITRQQPKFVDLPSFPPVCSKL